MTRIVYILRYISALFYTLLGLWILLATVLWDKAREYPLLALGVVFLVVTIIKVWW